MMPAKPPSPPLSHAAPRLVEAMKDREVREGEPVQFQCRIVGVPDPVVQWFYNNQVMQLDLLYITGWSQNIFRIYVWSF